MRLQRFSTLDVITAYALTDHSRMPLHTVESHSAERHQSRRRLIKQAKARIDEEQENQRVRALTLSPLLVSLHAIYRPLPTPRPSLNTIRRCCSLDQALDHSRLLETTVSPFNPQPGTLLHVPIVFPYPLMYNATNDHVSNPCSLTAHRRPSLRPPGPASGGPCPYPPAQHQSRPAQRSQSCSRPECVCCAFRSPTRATLAAGCNASGP